MIKKLKILCGLFLFFFLFQMSDKTTLKMTEMTDRIENTENPIYNPILNNPQDSAGLPTNFSSIWNTRLTSTGSSNSSQVKLPLQSTGTYGFTIYWGDSNQNYITSWNQPEVTHTYSSGGTYTINITGTLWGWCFNGTGDRLKIIEIKQWGSMRLGNSGHYFSSCSNLKLTATDNFNITGTTILTWAFGHCSSLGSMGNLNGWNTSKITDMSYMFYQATSFNLAVGNWDVSQVIDMDFMFYDTAFNQSIEKWNVSKVTSMMHMFSYAIAFNQPLGDWDVSHVTDMSLMFYEASTFNHPIGDWDVSHVTDMSLMFYEASTFNQPIGDWDVAQVTDMSAMFGYASEFNQPIGNWDVSKVTKMNSMFNHASSFNQPIGNWDISNVNRMDYMFYYASSFNQPINDWNVSQVNDMEGIFFYATSFNQPLESWDVSHVTKMVGLFACATSFNRPIGNWNVSNVKDMSGMFLRASAFNQPLGNWNIANVRIIQFMFKEASSFNQPLDSWDVSNITSLNSMFESASSFNQPIGHWNTTKVYTLEKMFYNATAFNQPIGEWDVSHVDSLDNTFAGATSFNQPIGGWDVSHVTDMRYAFYNATTFNQPIGDWDVSQVTVMYYMFSHASSFNQPIGTWNTSKVRSMQSMFSYATSFNQPIGAWNISSVSYMSSMMEGISLSTSNYDNLLNGWASFNVKSNVSFHAGYSKYSDNVSLARSHLISHNWSIIDGGKAPFTVQIVTPRKYQTFGIMAPQFSIVIPDTILIGCMWYTFNGDPVKHYFTENTSIDQIQWATIIHGNFATLRFYVEDILQNVAWEEVIVEKDTLAPLIYINNPSNLQIFGESSPSFNVRITDAHLDAMWYSLDGGQTIYPFTNNGTIDPNTWTLISNATMVNLRIYAKDEGGNLNWADIFIQKLIMMESTTKNEEESTNTNQNMLIWYGLGLSLVSIGVGTVIGRKITNRNLQPNDLKTNKSKTKSDNVIYYFHPYRTSSYYKTNLW